MDILVLGGTRFVGRHVVEDALNRGHTVTLFHRGQTNRSLFPDARSVHGDRDGGLEALGDGPWDAVIDTCGYVPRVVRQSVEYLKPRCRHYTFISTISVYRDFADSHMNESAPLGTLADPTVETIDGDTYGPLKVLCEKEVRRGFGDRAFIPRPGLIVGPHDPTDRFTYWPGRFDRGGEVLCPGTPDRRLQFIDARDLGAWILDRVEAADASTVHATGPVDGCTMGSLVEICDRAASAHTRPVWVDDAFLLEHEVGPWMELPLWLPGDDNAGLMHMDLSKARRSGLITRPVEETVRDTLLWHRQRPAERLKAGLAADREAELLDLWKGQSPEN